MNDAGLAKELAGRGLDVTVPNVARIYDYFLGGKDNFAADREAAEELRSLLPDAEIACRETAASCGARYATWPANRASASSST
jgi:hypothetical protein